MSLTGRIASLAKKHAGLEKQIEDEMARPLPNSSVLDGLKKRKLRLKEEIAAHEQRLTVSPGSKVESNTKTEAGEQKPPLFELEVQSDQPVDVPEFPDSGDVISFAAHHHSAESANNEQVELPLAANA